MKPFCGAGSQLDWRSAPGSSAWISRSRIYELIESGDLQIVKVGRSTLIPFKSLRALVGG